MKKHKIFLAIIYAIAIFAVWYIKFDPAFFPYDVVWSTILTGCIVTVAVITLKKEVKHGACTNENMYWCDSEWYCTMWEFPNYKDKIELACKNCTQVNSRVNERLNELDAKS